MDTLELRELDVQEKKQVQGGGLDHLACFGAGLAAAAIFSQPLLLLNPGVTSAGTALAAACVAG